LINPERRKKEEHLGKGNNSSPPEGKKMKTVRGKKNQKNLA